MVMISMRQLAAMWRCAGRGGSSLRRGRRRLVVLDGTHLGHGDRMGGLVVAGKLDFAGRTGKDGSAYGRAVAHQHSSVLAAVCWLGTRGKKKNRQECRKENSASPIEDLCAHIDYTPQGPLPVFIVAEVILPIVRAITSTEGFRPDSSP